MNLLDLIFAALFSTKTSAQNYTHIERPIEAISPTPTLSPIKKWLVNHKKEQELYVGKGKYSRDSLGNINYSGENGENGIATEDSLGITHYRDNQGYSSDTLTDSLGNKTTYDNQGNSSFSMSDSLGNTRTYSGNDVITSITDSLGNTTFMNDFKTTTCIPDSLGNMNCY